MNITDYLVDQCEAILKIDHDAVRRQVEILKEMRMNGRGCVYIFGNGGSHALASHAVCDFRNAEVWSVCLGDNVPFLTATANDSGYENVFLHGIPTVNARHDVVLVISVSGKSENIVQALGGIDPQSGPRTMAWLGESGAAMAEAVDEPIIIDSNDFGVVEAAHDALLHLITAMLKE